MSTKRTVGDRSQARVLVVAGEASGDRLGAELLRELRRLEPGVRAYGVGGPQLRSSGLGCVAAQEEITTMGATEVLGRVPALVRAFFALVGFARIWQPQVAVLIDFPDFNLRLARRLRRLGVCVIYYVSPQVWAWRRGRIRSIARDVDHMMVIFRFEERLYQKAAVPVTYVGHPLADRTHREPQSTIDTPDLPGTLALFPGSRPSEVRRMFPPMLAVVKRILGRRPDLKILVAQAESVPDEMLEQLRGPGRVPLEVVKGCPEQVLERADLGLIASGTATLEAAVAEVPMVVVYKTSWLTYWVARALVRGVESIAMVNILAGERVVPEVIQRLDPVELEYHLMMLLEEDPVRTRMQGELKRVARELGEPGAAARAALVVFEHLRPEAGSSVPGAFGETPRNVQPSWQRAGRRGTLASIRTAVARRSRGSSTRRRLRQWLRS